MYAIRSYYEPLLQLSPADLKRIQDDVETLIPKAVEEIHAYWRDHGEA